MEALEHLKGKWCLFLLIYWSNSEELHCTFLDQHNFPPSPIWHSLNTHSLSAVSPFLSHSSTICSTCFPINSWLGLGSPALSLSVSGLQAGAIRKASQNFLCEMNSHGKPSRGLWEVSLEGSELNFLFILRGFCGMGGQERCQELTEVFMINGLVFWMLFPEWIQMEEIKNNNKNITEFSFLLQIKIISFFPPQPVLSF